MNDYQTVYLILGIFLLVISVAIGFARKDLIPQMVIMAVIFGLNGLIADPLYRKGFEEITTQLIEKINLESGILGAGLGAFCTAIYDILFFKKPQRAASFNNIQLFNKRIVVPLFSFFLFFSFIFIFDADSFLSMTVAMLSGTALMIMFRRDMLKQALYSGTATLIVVFIVINAVHLLIPSLSETWVFFDLPRIIILGVQVDDVIFFFLHGTFLGILFEFWQGILLEDQTMASRS